jgi:transcriptional regulator with XRE-family HTH domain
MLPTTFSFPQKGLSQQLLALEAGISKNQVGNIERGEVNECQLKQIISLFKEATGK